MATAPAEPLPLAETITAWRCIGCGKLESPQNCIGVCQDRKVELVDAWDYAEALTRLEAAHERIAKLEALAGKLAHTTPRANAWEASYRALQAEAGRLLAARD
jgi:hypothetical protein